MTGNDLKKILDDLTPEELELDVVASDDIDDGFNFIAGAAGVTEVADLDGPEGYTHGPFIVIAP